MTAIGRRAIAAAVLPLSLFAGGCRARGPGTESAADPQAFFRGKTMTYIVATEPGGGYDTYGRLVAKYLSRHLGLSTVVVKNVPGGGHLRGANAIHAARADGLTIGTFNTGLLYAQLLRREGMAADLRGMSWIGKAGLEPRVLTVSARSGFRSFDDIRNAGRPLLLGTSGAGNESYYDALLLAHALGLQVRLVFGLPSREAQLSMMRGEIDGEIGSASTYRSFVQNGYGYTVLRVGASDSVDATVPDASDLAATPAAKAIVGVVGSLSRLLRWTAGPPGIPADRLAVLRAAYMSALQDPALLAEASKLQIPIVPMDGATLAAEIEQVLAMPPAMLSRIASIVEAGLER